MTTRASKLLGIVGNSHDSNREAPNGELERVVVQDSRKKNSDQKVVSGKPLEEF